MQILIDKIFSEAGYTFESDFLISTKFTKLFMDLIGVQVMHLMTRPHRRSRKNNSTNNIYRYSYKNNFDQQTLQRIWLEWYRHIYCTSKWYDLHTISTNVNNISGTWEAAILKMVQRLQVQTLSSYTD
ncbi:MAG: hypothetical protein CM15mV105_020 [uncultured marine virus]|nr:MAG: hypothetical protein CM15mV105_020 [uncultured marine virus]